MIEQVFDKILQIFKFRTYVKCSCNNYVNVNLYNSELKLHGWLSHRNQEILQSVTTIMWQVICKWC